MRKGKNKRDNNLSQVQRAIMSIIDDLRTFDCPEDIIRQIENHFMLPLVSEEVRALLRAKQV